jgi:hypothetical protein
MSLEKPRFRRDLEAAPVEADGERYVEVRDLGTGKSFFFYDFEYRVALAFDGLALDKVIPWVKLSTGLELTVDQLQSFAARLEEMGFLEGKAGPAPAPEALAPPSPPDEVALPSDPPSEVPPAPNVAVGEGAANAPDSNQMVAEKTETVEEVDAVEEVEAAEEASAPASSPAESSRASAESGAPLAEPGALQAEPSSPPPKPSPELAEARAQPAEPGASPTAPSAQVAEVNRSPTEPSVPLLESSPVAVAPRAEVIAVAAPKIEESAARETGSPPNAASDSSAFPVLPAPASRAPASEVAPPSAPPPWATTRPLMTPVPVTFGPIVEPSSTRRRLRRSLILFGSLGVLAAAAILALVLPFLFAPPEPPRPRVRTLTAAPGTILRYFDSAGVVQSLPGLTLKFPAAGKVTRMAGVGSTVAVGDIAAAVEIARPLQDQLTRLRERLAFYQQMTEAMHQVGNSKEEERNAAKAELRNERIAKTLRALADVAVVVDAPGVVEETFAREGDTVEAGGPAMRLRSAGFRATFEFSRQQAAQARRLGFCQVESDGYVFDCAQIQDGGDETHLGVEIASLPQSLLGKAAHLARARFEGAFVVPLTAVVRTGSRNEALLVSQQSRIEPRPVTIVESDATEAIVVQGLDAGDHVVVENVPGLRVGAPVSVAP